MAFSLENPAESGRRKSSHTDRDRRREMGHALSAFHGSSLSLYVSDALKLGPGGERFTRVRIGPGDR